MHYFTMQFAPSQKPSTCCLTVSVCRYLWPPDNGSVSNVWRPVKVGPQSHLAGFDGGPSTFSHPQICEIDETVIDSEAYFWDLLKNY